MIAHTGLRQDPVGYDAFISEWFFAADRLLASALIDPPAFVETIDTIGVDDSFMPTTAHKIVFGFAELAGRDGLRPGVADMAMIVDLLADGTLPITRKELERIAYSCGSSVNVATFAVWCWEYGIRRKLYAASDQFLSDPRPVGEIAKGLLEVVANVG